MATSAALGALLPVSLVVAPPEEQRRKGGLQTVPANPGVAALARCRCPLVCC